jgi:cell volume regulation protein A
MFLAGLAIVILLGFIAGLIFRATRVPDILILMGAGIALGPYGLGWVTPEELAPLLPAFTALALVMILFTGGLGMPLGSVLRGAPVATLFTMLVLGGSIAVTTGVTHYLLHWPLSEGAMLGAILGGTSSATVLGLLRGAPVSERCNTLLSLESSITDVLCITVLVALVQTFTGPSSDMTGPAAQVGIQFGLGIAAGVIAGFLWGELARRARKLKLEFMVTLAVVFGLYVGVDYAGGSGAVTALVFGIVMASRGKSALPSVPVSPTAAASTMMPAVAEAVAEDGTRELRTFHDELAFLLRTLFFLILGIRFPLEGPPFKVWLALAAILVGWAIVRWIIAFPVSLMGRLDRRDRFATVHLFPRGMVAAVLATLPAQYAHADGTPLLAASRGDEFVLISFLVIGLTTLWSSVAVMFTGAIEPRQGS